jgi:chromate transporter
MTSQPKAAKTVSLLRLARIALWLGIAGFGGGFAIVQQLKLIVVHNNRWFSEEEFLEYFAIASALPGTPSTNILAILGVRLKGLVGGVLSATLFLLPSVAVMVAFAAGYRHIRNVAVLGTFFDGMSLATIGVVAGVAADIGRSSLKRPFDWALALFAAIVLIAHALSLLEVMALAALCGAVFMRHSDTPSSSPQSQVDKSSFRPSLMPGILGLTLSASPLVVLLIVFARIGVATFGGGFAMIPAIEHEIVTARHWLSEAAFNDAIVLGQITPGPVAIAASFIGYRIAGLGGAAVATLGMFAPPLILSLVAGRSTDAFRSNATIHGALRAVTPAMVGILAAAAIALWKTSVHGVWPATVAIAATFVILCARRILPLVILVAGGLAMLAIARLR